MGAAFFHIAWSKEHGAAAPTREEMADPAVDPLLDEDEII